MDPAMRMAGGDYRWKHALYAFSPSHKIPFGAKKVSYIVAK